MEILEAYCEELKRVVDIYEAQEEYFALPEIIRKRFSFRCSDPTCRASNNPLVSGVNYHRNVEGSEKYRQPHFKSLDKHPHISQCIWVLGEARRRKQNRDDGLEIEGRRTRLSHSKATNVIDFFEPRHSDVLRSMTLGAVEAPTMQVDAAVTHGQYRVHDRAGITTTSRLEKLIDCWSEMARDERRNHSIAVNGQTINYQQLCLRVTQLWEYENGRRVVYGGARVKEWPTPDEPTHYFVNFMDHCDRFADVAGEKSLTISLPIKRLQQARRGPLLMERIKQSSLPKRYLKVYAWGEIVKRSRGKGYELKLEALDNVVLKVIESKGNRLRSAATSSASPPTADGTADQASTPLTIAVLPVEQASTPANSVTLPISLAPPVAPAQSAHIDPPAPTYAELPSSSADIQTTPTMEAPSVISASSSMNPAVNDRDAPKGILYRLFSWVRKRR